MEKGKIKFNFNIKKRLAPVILLAVCTPLVFFVAIPFEVYANNMDEFLFSLSAFYPYCILFGFLLAAGIAGGLLFLPEKIYRIAYALILAFSFLFFMQGTFLNFGMNSLGGDNLGSNSENVGLKVLDLLIWLAVLGVALALSIIKDKKGIFAIIAVILAIVVIATQIITPLASTVKHPDVFKSRTARLLKEDPDYEDEILTCENLTSVSEDRNVFFFLIDKFDEYFAEVADKQNPEIYSNLDGFTWFQDDISLYGHTFPSVAYMLTENEYDTAQLRKPFLDTAYNENQTLSVLHENGYNVNLFTKTYYAYNTANTLPDYIENISVAKEFKVTRPMELVRCMVRTSFYRCLPLFFKDLMYSVETSEYNMCVSSVGENGYEGYSSINDTVYSQIAKADFDLKAGKNFTFVHIDGVHNLAVNYLEEKVTSKQKKEITASVENSFRVVNKFINALKEKGLYENATIIISGDHPVTVQARYAPKGAKLTALFFKRSGEAGTKLAVSTAPVAHENIWPTIMKSEGITRTNEGTTLFEIPENDTTRERKHVFHTYHSNKCDEYIYTITGSGKDFKNWKLVEHNHLNHSYME